MRSLVEEKEEQTIVDVTSVHSEESLASLSLLTVSDVPIALYAGAFLP
jgi:hypothetical protein